MLDGCIFLAQLNKALGSLCYKTDLEFGEF